ncbi:ABC transporter ATP-binding protein [Streptococcus iniae]|uniref:Putative hemin import ATP-binding protein HrtA n=1 Tax=Streptococcus iniae TaxID=1346 RepID=A0A3L8GJ88_STRIN|nr:ABC transporter ATP-binding protein [Streptococcus iniae]AGM99020.1 lipoprotein releasing system, ATP-binding protein [Streptococcus iniae SF1]AHY15969.1 hemin ABC transporter ATP-binding protein [Streptococcus iniae]AHY17835.1 hemin ABC transporter ATP-binding protein [Streptococcus iniae]AJG26127.1 hemin ABC transporter ATP-binding protein [Streptococcus iniae]APD32005.1 hemin ABC transporter ATP-binding protein [Streptococcus iniae]
MERILQFIGVSKTFQDGNQKIQALKATDFTIEAGQFVAVIGPSGSGKSTFLTLAGGLQTPTKGQIIINGSDYTQLPEKERAKRRFEDIGFILQTSNLIPFLTAEQQLELVDRLSQKRNHDQKQTLFKELEISHLAKKFPKDISGGERQRLAIARALYNNPALILADEPTASLDTKRAHEVVSLLLKECREKNKAIIMVTHDQRMIEECDYVYYMEDGVLRKHH